MLALLQMCLGFRALGELLFEKAPGLWCQEEVGQLCPLSWSAQWRAGGLARAGWRAGSVPGLLSSQRSTVGTVSQPPAVQQFSKDWAPEGSAQPHGWQGRDLPPGPFSLAYGKSLLSCGCVPGRRCISHQLLYNKSQLNSLKQHPFIVSEFPWVGSLGTA